MEAGLLGPVSAAAQFARGVSGSGSSCPLVWAIDSKGSRLGQGKGHYDRVLAKVARAWRLANRHWLVGLQKARSGSSRRSSWDVPPRWVRFALSGCSCFDELNLAGASRSESFAILALNGDLGRGDRLAVRTKSDGGQSCSRQASLPRRPESSGSYRLMPLLKMDGNRPVPSIQGLESGRSSTVLLKSACISATRSPPPHDRRP